MFCPNIKGKCKGAQCRDWDEESQRCIVQVGNERVKQRDAQMDKFISMQQEVLNLYRTSEMWTRANVKIMLLNPTISDEIKNIVREALAAPSTEVAEKVLRDAGLLD